jgi:hypothetical protein
VEQPADGDEEDEQNGKRHAARDQDGLHCFPFQVAGATQKNSPSLS